MCGESTFGAVKVAAQRLKSRGDGESHGVAGKATGGCGESRFATVKVAAQRLKKLRFG